MALAAMKSKCPHSLGIPIEWKLTLNGNYISFRITVPTRWGSQLNGNSLGGASGRAGSRVPTRWGSQLNGNLLPPRRLGGHELSPLAGDPN